MSFSYVNNETCQKTLFEFPQLKGTRGEMNAQWLMKCNLH